MEGGLASFIEVGTLLKRTAPEYLNMLFPNINLGFVK